MANPILNQINSNRSVQVSGITDLINKFVGTAGLIRDPRMAIQTLIQNNPKYRQYERIVDQVNDYVAQNGGDEKAAFMKFAKEKGVDGNAILSMFKR